MYLHGTFLRKFAYACRRPSTGKFYLRFRANKTMHFSDSPYCVAHTAIGSSYFKREISERVFLFSYLNCS
jgi:hypothetical protein